MNMPDTVFVWTLKDAIGALVIAGFAVYLLWALVDNWIDKRFRKKKKYYHKP